MFTESLMGIKKSDLLIIAIAIISLMAGIVYSDLLVSVCQSVLGYFIEMFVKILIG